MKVRVRVEFIVRGQRLVNLQNIEKSLFFVNLLFCFKKFYDFILNKFKEY